MRESSENRSPSPLRRLRRKVRLDSRTGKGGVQAGCPSPSAASASASRPRARARPAPRPNRAGSPEELRVGIKQGGREENETLLLSYGRKKQRVFEIPPAAKKVTIN